MIAARRAALLAASICAFVPVAAPARTPPPLSPSTIVAKLNAERSRLGMFAGVTEEPSWSAKCRLHNRWMKLNHRVDHAEVRGTPGYSADGHWAGTNAVLSGPDAGWRTGNPWRNAPLHLSVVYDPLLRRVGTSDAHRHACMTTWPGIRLEAAMQPFGTPQADHIFTFPVDGGTAPFGQLAYEFPFTPQEKVGLRRSQKTGPYLYVWSYMDLWHDAAGPLILDHDEAGQPIYFPSDQGMQPLALLVSGSLTDASGRSVPVKAIDNIEAKGVNDGAGFLLPVRPLKPATTYRATVVLATGPGTSHWPGPTRQVTHSWSFTTARRALGYRPAGCRGQNCRPWTFRAP